DSIFSSHFRSPPAPKLASKLAPLDKAISTRNRILPQVSSIQGKIEYSFKNELLLIEAMTHSSYHRNDITGCYQRLEFLGDAILDYLVTCHIYQSDSSAEPGRMTELRSALVCNSRFAELAISLNLHRSLCHGSPNLFNDMKKYAQSLKQREKEDRERKLEEMSINDDDSAQVIVESMEDGDIDDDEDEDDDIIEPPKSLSDCFEALAGAVFIDSGMNLQTVWETFSPFLEPLFEKFKNDPPLTPICELHKLIPKDLEVKKKVLSEGKSQCIIEIKDKNICEVATARSYKNAKNFAASRVLKKLA
uniref:RNase III domain-containing protein n=1 Tax=Amphimedon queenslandica TaxID=400682 RepID=A0A1X7SLK6_AMPQE